MNCLEFRRQLAIDPHVGGDFARHHRECSRCAAAHVHASAFEQTLRNALDVRVPANLAESILLAQATRERHAGGIRRRAMWIAAAAAAVLAVGLGMTLQAKPLPDLVVAHLKKEAFLLGKTQAISDDEIRKAFATFGIVINDVPAGSSFVACCPVGKFVSVHLVVPESDGPVTVLYLVDDAHEARHDFIKDGWFGRTIPTAHGTLVLLGHDAAQFDRLESEWGASLGTATFNTDSAVTARNG